MLDTGILICHLVRIIQDRAKVILSHHVHNEGSAPANKPSEPAATVPGDPAFYFFFFFWNQDRKRESEREILVSIELIEINLINWDDVVIMSGW